MLPYRHTQVGVLVLGIVTVPVAVLIMVSVFVHVEVGALMIVGLLLVAAFLFGTLTVEVDHDAVSIRFGPGIVCKRFPLSDIRAARIVRNNWYCGWGIHRLPNGWLYNVSGLDAVELELADGTRPRIGTTHPRDLDSAIREAIARQGSQVTPIRSRDR